MKRSSWIVSLLLALVLAIVPVLANYRVLWDSASAVEGVRVCRVQMDRWSFADIVYVDENENDQFDDDGSDTVLFIRTWTQNRITRNVVKPNTTENRLPH